MRHHLARTTPSSKAGSCRHPDRERVGWRDSYSEKHPRNSEKHPARGSSGGGRGEGDGEAQAFEPLGEAPRGALGVGGLVVVGAQLAIGLAVLRMW